jgi:hypothetical protein
MEAGLPIGGARRGFRRWRGVVLGLAVSPFLLLLFANLLLTSPWSRGRMAGKISRATGGLEARIDAASWTPWNGISLRGIELLQPLPLRAAAGEPLLRVAAVRADPVWRSWLRGRPEISGLVVDSPRLVLPLELLSHLAKSAPAAPTPAPAPLPPAAPPPAVAAAPPNAAAPAKPAPPVAPPAAQKAAPRVPTAVVEVRNGSLSLRLAAPRRELLEISGIDGSIPIAGGPGRSTLGVGRISLMEKDIATRLTAGLVWQAPFLSIEPLELAAGGHRAMVAGRIALVGGLPLQVELKLPPAPLAECALPFGAQAAAQSVAAEARFRGLLLAPATWQADLLGESLSPVITTAGRQTRFERATAVIVLRGGVLSCPALRITGDDLSLLGNATLLADGRLAGALRLVAPPDTAAYAAKRVFPNLLGEPRLTPLATPQRAAFDVEASGTLGRIFLRLGREGPVVQLQP